MIRLACIGCDSDEFDGITEEQLADAIASGWVDVQEVQSYADAIASIPVNDKRRSVFDWWTHLGWCPVCREEMGE